MNFIDKEYRVADKQKGNCMKFFDLFKSGDKTVLSNAAMDGSRPALTVGQAEKLLGDKIDHMVMYNMKTLKPLKDTYNEQKVIYGGHVSAYATTLKDMCAHSIIFKNKKPMWIVAKTVSAWEDKDYHLLKSNTKYDEYGCLIIGNAIFYDFKQKKYITLYPNGDWVRVDKTYRSYNAARESILNTFVTLCSTYVK